MYLSNRGRSHDTLTNPSFSRSLKYITSVSGSPLSFGPQPTPSFYSQFSSHSLVAKATSTQNPKAGSSKISAVASTPRCLPKTTNTTATTRSLFHIVASPVGGRGLRRCSV